MTYALVALLAVVAGLLVYVAIQKASAAKAHEREALQKLKEYQLAVIVEAAKKKAKIDADAQAEKSKLDDMSNAELEIKVNEP